MTIAVETACPIVLPNAMMTLKMTSMMKFVANEQAIAPIAKRARPMRWNRFLPIMSATLPSGSISELTVRDCAMTISETWRSVMPKSVAMESRARNMMLKLITIVTSDNPTAENAFHL